MTSKINTVHYLNKNDLCQINIGHNHDGLDHRF
jgi:hypothetical protein